MARGWESKAIESQQEEAARRKRPERPLSETERATLEKRRAIELALSNARSDLAAAKAPAHRSMLTQKIAALEAELARL
jgi:hypothetical protein